MDEISGKFTLKDGTVEEPRMYLGANIGKEEVIDDSGNKIPCWGISSSNYTAKAITKVDRILDSEEYGHVYLPKKKVPTPLLSGYRPESDPTKELNDEQQHQYQGLVGVLRWMCELGRLDILHPMSLMSRCLAQARIGHLNQIPRTFACLNVTANPS